MRGARRAPWPSHARGRLAAGSLTILVALTSPASADETPPATFRDGLGWNCYRSRALGDLDGDGGLDRAVLFDRFRHRVTCEARRMDRARMFLRVRFAGGVGFQIRFGCSFCSLEAQDFDRDGRRELAVRGPGASFASVDPYRVFVDHLRPLRFRGSAPPRTGLLPGRLHLGISANSAYRHGFGCRTHPDGARVLIVYSGGARHRSTGPWDFIRARLRFDGRVFRYLGLREYTAPRGRWPDLPTPPVDDCGRALPS